MTRKEEIREAAVMETGNRYLLQSSFGSLFEVKCIEVTDTAFKIFNIIQKSEQWMKKSDFGPYGSYSVYADLGLTAPESSPKEKKVGGMATVYPLGNEVVSLTKPEGWIDGVGVQSSTARTVTLLPTLLKMRNPPQRLWRARRNCGMKYSAKSLHIIWMTSKEG